MYDVGSVIIMKNIVFKNGNKCYDHYYRKGRPCLVVARIDDKVYFLTLTSKLKNAYEDLEFIGNDYVRKKSFVNIGSIYCRDAYYYKEICKIDNDDLLRILHKFSEFQTMNCTSDLFLEIKDSIEKTIESITCSNDLGRCKCKIRNN